jgi:hypothetical protein
MRTLLKVCHFYLTENTENPGSLCKDVSVNAVYCVYHSKHAGTLCGQNADFVRVIAAVDILSTDTSCFVWKVGDIC